MMNIRAAKPEVNETEAVFAFYNTLIDGMEGMEYHPKWKKGIYPDEGWLYSSMEKGELYIAEETETGEILAAMVINGSQNDGYAGAEWQYPAEEGEYYVIHALGVAVKHMRRGIGSAMVAEALRLANAHGKKTVRLDVIDGNLPAGKLYTGMGFTFAEHRQLYYEDTGWCGFDLYECSTEG